MYKADTVADYIGDRVVHEQGNDKRAIIVLLAQLARITQTGTRMVRNSAYALYYYNDLSWDNDYSEKARSKLREEDEELIDELVKSFSNLKKYELWRLAIKSIERLEEEGVVEVDHSADGSAWLRIGSHTLMYFETNVLDMLLLIADDR